MVFQRALSTKVCISVFLGVFFIATGLLAKPLPQENPFEGRLVKVADSSAVYYVGLDGKRHAFPNARIFFSWYDNFQTVEIIDSLEMALLPLGNNVLYRPGTRLVKLSDVPEVYAVEPGGILRNIPSEDVARALYGPRWAELVDDLDISFFFDYEIGGVVDIIDGRPLYPRGTFVSYESEPFVVDKSSEGVFWLRPFLGEALRVNGFERIQRYTIVDTSWREFYELGLPVAAPEVAYACPACAPDEAIVWGFHARQIASTNGRYSIEIPTEWQASAFQPPASDVITVIFSAWEEIGGEEPDVQVNVFRHPRGGSTDESFLQDLRDAKSLAYREAAYGPSPTRVTMTHYIGLADTGVDTQEPTFVWVSVLPSSDAFYEIQVHAPLNRLAKLREVIDRVIRTFTVNEAVPE